MHDFRAKLSDPRAAAAVESYLRRARRRRTSKADAGEPFEDDPHGPLSINLDLTFACEYRCAHCIDGELLNGGRHIELETVLGTLRGLARRGLRSVILIGGGEPTLYPRFDAVVSEIKTLGLECAIVSNGAHNDRLARVAPLLGPKDWVRLSLDAGTDATFQALHRPRKPITLERICRTASALKQAAPHVQLGFSFVVTWISPGQRCSPVAVNAGEMGQAAALARQHGFDYISFKPMLVRDSARAEVINLGRPGEVGAAEREALEEIRRGLLAAEACAGNGFRVVPSTNLAALLNGSLFEQSVAQPRECHMQQFRHVVSPAGIFACPAHRGNGASRLASETGYAAAEHWRETATAVERQIRRFDASVECRHIACIYNQTNWWLEGLLTHQQTVEPLAAPDLFL